jgi:hypothetical protein
MIVTRRTLRGAATRLAIFAVLYQALLFGWHHHRLSFADGRHAPLASIENSTAPAPPAADEDGCAICSVLHHQVLAGGELAAALPLPIPSAAAPAGDEPVAVPRQAGGFRARAPPLV